MSDNSRKTGGVGEFLPPGKYGNFGLKIVKLKNDTKEYEPGKFWGEAKSIRTYGSFLRFLGGTSKVPFASRFYINREDPLYKKFMQQFPRKREYGFHELFCEFSLTDQEEIKKRFKNYVYVPEELLQEICDKQLEADLLLAYPIEGGGECCLEKLYGSFSEEDVKGLILQILSVILELFRCGVAHGDIKPQNIMVSNLKSKKRKIFRLIDFGSFHAETAPSDSTTPSYYDKDLYNNVLKKTGDILKARVYTDIYALGRTVLAMALGKTPDILANPASVTDKWQGIEKLWVLFDPLSLEKRSLEEFEKVVSDNIPVDIPSDWQPFRTPLKEIFDPLDDYGYYGKLREQLRLPQETFDPVMLVDGTVFDSQIYRAIPKFYHRPLIQDLNSRLMIFHAPDDWLTGKRPADFSHYEPRSLTNSTLSSSEKKELVCYGRKLDKYFKMNRSAQKIFPRKEDIFWCDGSLKILWGKGFLLSNDAVSYQDYFRYLAGDKIDFTDDAWYALLPCFSELENFGTPERWEIFLTEEHLSPYSYIWSLQRFRKYVTGKAQDLTPEQWKICLQAIPVLKKKLTVKICRKILQALIEEPEKFVCFFGNEVFRKKISKEKQNFSMKVLLLIRKYTNFYDEQIAERIASSPELFRIYFRLQPCSTERFLRAFPEKIRAGFDARLWSKFLCANPALLDYVPPHIVQLLTRKAWVRILGIRPEMVNICPKLNSFSSAEWVSILIQSPELKKYLPDSVPFSTGQEKKLNKKNNFF